MNDWWSCNGEGEYGRRTVLRAAGAAIGMWAGARTALSQVALRRPDEAKNSDAPVLVSIFLRGGMDGLHAAPPYAEDQYHSLRPSLRLHAPSDRTAAEADRCLDLDGHFGLHPQLRGLLPLYQQGNLAVVHAVGSQDHSHSHFEAMSAMERGVSDAARPQHSGWLARLMGVTPLSRGPLASVALGSVLPDSLRGASGSVVMDNLTAYRLDDSLNLDGPLRRLYSIGDDPLTRAGRDTLAALAILERLDASSNPSKVKYPDSDLGQGLKQVAILIRSGVGLRVAALDKGGWDTHVAQGVGEGWMALQLKDLGDSLEAFAADLGQDLARVTTIVQTEFGRRASENDGQGTDHGAASAMFVLGGGVRGGRVITQWPGLNPDQLSGPGDLATTTDYRDVLAEVMVRHELASVERVFPDFRATKVGLFV